MRVFFTHCQSFFATFGGKAKRRVCYPTRTFWSVLCFFKGQKDWRLSNFFIDFSHAHVSHFQKASKTCASPSCKCTFDGRKAVEGKLYRDATSTPCFFGSVYNRCHDAIISQKIGKEKRFVP